MIIFWGKNAELAINRRALCSRTFYFGRLHLAVLSITSECCPTTFDAHADAYVGAHGEHGRTVS